MIKLKNTYYLTPALLAFLVFVSNFVKADIFGVGAQSYTVWFVLSLFSFACGWLINKTIGYSFGGKLVFAVIVANVAIALFMVSFFSEYFGFPEMTTENLLLYSLRIISIGSMGFFGMAVHEVIGLQNQLIKCELTKKSEVAPVDSTKQISIITEEAKLKSQKMIFEAEKQYNEILDKKNKLETKLKELITAERELIRKYESSENE